MAVFVLPADFPPVFHIKLKDQVLLEGEAATLLCLPAACPAPHISWMKGKENPPVTDSGQASGPTARGCSGEVVTGEGGLEPSHSAAPSALPGPQTSSPCNQSPQ